MEFHELASFDGKAWFTSRPKDLQSLILQLCGLNDLLFVTDKQFLTLSKIVEPIYGLHKSNLIAPLSFSKDLITHKISGSKQLVTYNSHLSPAGSYFYVNEWLNKKAEKAISFPSGTLKCMFDNSQNIGKTYKLNVNESQPNSIITTSVNAVLDDSDIQFNLINL